MLRGSSLSIPLKKLLEAVANLEEQIRLLGGRWKTIREDICEIENAFIKIDHGAKSGTAIKISEQLHVIETEIVGPKTVRLVNHEIAVV